MASNKIYYSVFGIPFIKLKKLKQDKIDIYIFGLPVFTYRVKKNKRKINLFVIQKPIEYFKQKIRKAKRKKSKNKILRRWQNGEKIKIALMAERPGMWSFDYLYELFKSNPQFDVNVVIMPEPFYGKAHMKNYMRETTKEMEAKGYNPIKGYDEESDKIINFKKEVNPDIIFYADFYKPHFVKQFYITKFLDKITLLTEYGFSVMQDEKTCAFELNNLVDLYFRPTDIHLDMATKLMKNEGKNVIVTGSPKLDPLFDKNYTYKDIWKPQEKPKKRIIWAPHYTEIMPDDMYKNDGFWFLHEFMFEVAEKFKDEVQFVFRPHPVLYTKVVAKWGQEEAENYYERWNKLENGQYYNGNFIDLFKYSDAMIMDSCSFMAEYTAFNKPLFHTITKTSRTKLNDFGEELYKNFYKTEDNLKEDIIKFIQDVVIGGNDYKAADRTKFVQQYFTKINNRTASENIYNEIIKFLERKI